MYISFKLSTFESNGSMQKLYTKHVIAVCKEQRSLVYVHTAVKMFMDNKLVTFNPICHQLSRIENVFFYLFRKFYFRFDIVFTWL